MFINQIVRVKPVNVVRYLLSQLQLKKHIVVLIKELTDILMESALTHVKHFEWLWEVTKG